MALLEFVFQSFWHFAGSVVLLTLLMSPLVTLAAAWGNRR